MAMDFSLRWKEVATAPSPSPSAIPPDLAGLLASQPPEQPSLSRTVTISASKSKSPTPALQMPEKKRSKTSTVSPNFDRAPEASEAAEEVAVEPEAVIAEASEELRCDAKEQEDDPACRPTAEPALNQAEAAQIAAVEAAQIVARGDVHEITARILGAQALEAQTLPITVPAPGNWWMAIAIAGAMLGIVYLLEDKPGGGMPLVGGY